MRKATSMSRQVSPGGITLGVAVAASVVLWNLYDLRDRRWAESVLTFAFFAVVGALVGTYIGARFAEVIRVPEAKGSGLKFGWIVFLAFFLLYVGVEVVGSQAPALREYIVGSGAVVVISALWTMARRQE